MGLPINENMTEALAVMAVVAPASQSTGTASFGPINMTTLKRLEVVLNVGSVGVAGTVDFNISTASASGASYGVLSGSQITQMTASGVALVEVKSETIGASGRGVWVKGNIVVGTNAVVTSAVALGAVSDYSPTSSKGMTLNQTAVVL